MVPGVVPDVGVVPVVGAEVGVVPAVGTGVGVVPGVGVGPCVGVGVGADVGVVPADGVGVVPVVAVGVTPVVAGALVLVGTTGPGDEDPESNCGKSSTDNKMMASANAPNNMKGRGLRERGWGYTTGPALTWVGIFASGAALRGDADAGPSTRGLG